MDGHTEFYLRQLTYSVPNVAYMGPGMVPHCVHVTLLPPLRLYIKSCSADTYLLFSLCEKKLEESTKLEKIDPFRVNSSLPQSQMVLMDLEMCPKKHFTKKHLVCDIDSNCRTNASDRYCTVQSVFEVSIISLMIDFKRNNRAMHDFGRKKDILTCKFSTLIRTLFSCT